MLTCTLKCNYVGEQQDRPEMLEDKAKEMGKQLMKVIKILGGIETELSGCTYIWDAYCGRSHRSIHTQGSILA